jgi:hypothetical protein
MFLKFDPYRVWYSIFYSKLVNCILFKIIVQHVCFVKGRGTCGSGERNVKIWIDFWKSPRFSLTSPLSRERKREVKSPCFYYVWWALGVMVSVLTSSAVDRGFEPWSGQTKDYEIAICCFSTKHAALRRKSKDWLARNQDNVSEWGDMSIRRLLFQWASTKKIQISVLV